jgi:hypothetical protein
VGYVSRIGNMKNAYRILVGISEWMENLGERGVDGREILNWFLNI